jgi:3-oxoacyl-[acyl-carrier protein] reductase
LHKNLLLTRAFRKAASGHQVVGIARRADDPAFPGTLVPADPADRRATDETLRDLAARSSFDGVVNNVGIIRLGRIGEIDIDQLEESFQ